MNYWQREGGGGEVGNIHASGVKAELVAKDVGGDGEEGAWMAMTDDEPGTGGL